SFLNALIIGTAGRAFDIYNQIQALQRQLFINTAEGAFLEEWGDLGGITRNKASQAKGKIAVTGTAATVIPAATLLQSNSELQYSTEGDETITVVPLTVFGITLSGQTATVTTDEEHHYGDGMTVTTSGANEAEYNGSFVIVVKSLTTYTHTVVGSPVTPATGAITSTATLADVEIKSVTFGKDTNKVSGDQISFVTPIAGADDNAIVQYEGLTGGEDIESDDDLRKRIIDHFAAPPSNFNPAQLEQLAKEVPGITTVFIKVITPDVGQVTIWPMKYNDKNVIPSAADAVNVKDRILEILPAHVDPDDVLVNPPNGIPVAFVFNNIVPNTASMKDAVTASLLEAFREKAIVGEDFLKIAYDSAIWQTVDTLNGDTITDFSLNTPGGDISVSDGSIAIRDTVTFLT
ncbi:hypothetical protein LCGC14_2774240, partial [marine sediment metagenome]